MYRRYRRRYRPAHPHAYGEHHMVSARFSGSFGSSPHIRGIPTHRAAGRNLGRLIPAHTGNTRAWLCRVCSPPAHPRAYREYPAISMTGDSSLGSSPHIRGTRAGKGFGLLSRGLIPAHTGNTEQSGLSKDCRPAHPRTYGEHLLMLRNGTMAGGSSPHIRGTHLATRHDA